MNPLTEKQLEKMLKQAPRSADLDRALAGVLVRAERGGLIDVAYARVDSPFGELLVARTDRGVVRLKLPGGRDGEISNDQALEDLATSISPRVLEGKRDAFEVPVDWALIPKGFRSRALHAVARIPYGKTRSYAEIARQAGNPRAFRAAGTACGHNPVPLIVPCHRVVQSGGGIGNYGGGPEMKRALLGLEGAI